MRLLPVAAAAMLLQPSRAHTSSRLVGSPRLVVGNLLASKRSVDSGLPQAGVFTKNLSASPHDTALRSPAPAALASSALLSADNLKLGLYLVVWYMGNIFYNLFNKYASIALGKDAHGHSNAHWVLSAAQVSCCL